MKLYRIGIYDDSDTLERYHFLTNTLNKNALLRNLQVYLNSDYFFKDAARIYIAVTAEYNGTPELMLPKEMVYKMLTETYEELPEEIIQLTYDIQSGKEVRDGKK